MVARASGAIEHWFWGRIVHDLAGVRHKPRIPIDYVHDEGQVIGYANKIEATNEGLEVSGALTPYKDSDRASEIIYKAAAGVPYEASIAWFGSPVRIEEIAEGDSAEVNGFVFEGPGMIVREWPLRGVAVVPYGADQNTSTVFSHDRVTVEIVSAEEAKKEIKMAEVNIEQESSELVREEIQYKDPVERAACEASAEAVEAVEAREEPAEGLENEGREYTGQDYLDAFGTQGAIWFAEGTPFDEAKELQILELQKKVVELEQKLSGAEAATGGEPEPMQHQGDGIDGGRASLQDLFRVRG
jgi:hypothetical protein